ncbi:MAG: hypothetical protein AB1Z22_01430 [Synechococcaceae cyanobacterium]
MAPTIRLRKNPLIAIALWLSCTGASQAIAEERVPIEAVRAINLARTYVVKLNGGLQVYRPAQCMFATADKTNPCLISSDSEGFVFEFMGGPPTWEQTNSPPTIESKIRISSDGTQVEELLYNGEPR